MTRYTGDWLVRAERVLALDPIPGADKIEKATIRGWEVVVKRNEFKVGDLGLFIPIDSVLPCTDDRFTFMEPKFRVKTVKLKGQVSQGLLMPLSLFPEVSWHKIPEEKISNINFASKFGIKKYEDPVLAKLQGSQAGYFPPFLPKTDQERIQNVPEVLAYGGAYEVTEKLDGTSFSAYHTLEGDYGICSRNYRMKDNGDSVYSFVSNKYKIKDHLPKGFAIQGEIIGPGIQSNRYNRTEPELRLFDVFDIANHRYLTGTEREDFLLRIPILHVPVVEKSRNILDFSSAKAIVDHADGESLVCPGVMREGLVFKSLELYNGQVTTFKAISVKWLLKYE